MKKTAKEHDKFDLKKGYDFSKGERGRFYRPRKKSTTIRLDDDVIIFFKKLSTARKSPYQTLMNDVLREYKDEHDKTPA